MSNLTNLEKRGFERLFGMGSGYVLNFSNPTFDQFVVDSVGRSIFEEKYRVGSGSKANCLRGFWALEPNSVVGKLLSDLLDYAVEDGIPEGKQEVVGACRRTIQRLLQDSPVLDIEAITPNSAERDFEVLAKSVRESIEKNEPESALDRLHTFVLKYMRIVCAPHGIETPREKPLHSLMGEYVKTLKKGGYLESEMSERILKSSISTLEAFNDVRNDKSLAHDNLKLLNYDESILIFNSISSCVRFIEAVERRVATKKAQAPKFDDFEDDIPF
jgi:hypothetical protein